MEHKIVREIVILEVRIEHEEQRNLISAFLVMPACHYVVPRLNLLRFIAVLCHKLRVHCIVPGFTIRAGTYLRTAAGSGWTSISRALPPFPRGGEAVVIRSHSDTILEVLDHRGHGQTGTPAVAFRLKLL